jgi:hypothetical protein
MEVSFYVNLTYIWPLFNKGSVKKIPVKTETFMVSRN